MALLGAGCLAAFPAWANERRFTQSYESLSLESGQKELELWTTPRVGRETAYTRFDNRLELEVGLSDRLVTAFYLNFTAISQGDYLRQSLAGSVSSEWKYKLLDPVADTVGLAGYLEVTGATDGVELEARLILDKRLGDVLLVLNLVAEPEWEWEDGEAKRELTLEQSLGVGYQLSRRVVVALEARHKMTYADEGFEHSALYVGPTLSWSFSQAWLAVSLLPQVRAFKNASSPEPMELHDNERFTGRLLLGFHI